MWFPINSQLWTPQTAFSPRLCYLCSNHASLSEIVQYSPPRSSGANTFLGWLRWYWTCPLSIPWMPSIVFPSIVPSLSSVSLLLSSLSYLPYFHTVRTIYESLSLSLSLSVCVCSFTHTPKATVLPQTRIIHTLIEFMCKSFKRVL